jgi:hypothetical protein
MISCGYGRLIYLSAGWPRRPRAATIALGTAKSPLTSSRLRPVAAELGAGPASADEVYQPAQ